MIDTERWKTKRPEIETEGDDQGAWHTNVSAKECRECVRGSEDIGKTSMYTRLDEYDVFRNSAQRQTDDGKCSERNA